MHQVLKPTTEACCRPTEWQPTCNSYGDCLRNRIQLVQASALKTLDHEPLLISGRSRSQLSDHHSGGFASPHYCVLDPDSSILSGGGHAPRRRPVSRCRSGRGAWWAPLRSTARASGPPARSALPFVMDMCYSSINPSICMYTNQGQNN